MKRFLGLLLAAVLIRPAIPRTRMQAPSAICPLEDRTNVLRLYVPHYSAPLNSAMSDCWTGCCRNWNDFARACRCEGGTPLANPLRCLHNGGPPVDPRVLQRQRYQGVLQNALVIDAGALSGYDINDDAQFAQAITKLYAGLYRNIAFWKAYAFYYEKQTDLELYNHDHFYLPRFSKTYSADHLDQSVRQANQEAKSELAALNLEIDRQKSIRDRVVDRNQSVLNADKLWDRSETGAKKWIAVYLGGLPRNDVQRTWGAASPSPTKAPCCEETPFLPPPYWFERPLAPHEIEDTALAAKKDAEGASNIAVPPLQGDPDARLQTIEGMVPQATSALKSFQEWRDYYQKTIHEPRTVWDEQHWDEISTKNIEVMRETHRLREVDIPQARIDLQWFKDVFKGDTFDFLYSGGEAAAWTFFRTYFIEPEAKRIALQYHYARPLSDEEVEQAWKVGELNIFKAYKGYLKSKASYSLIKQAKSLEGNAERNALAVAEVLGKADAGDVKEIGDKVFSGLDEESRKEVRTAMSQVKLPFVFKKFWEAYFVGTKPSFQPDE